MKKQPENMFIDELSFSKKGNDLSGVSTERSASVCPGIEFGKRTKRDGDEIERKERKQRNNPSIFFGILPGL